MKLEMLEMSCRSVKVGLTRTGTETPSMAEPDSALLDWVPNRSASAREIGFQPPIMRSSQLSLRRSYIEAEYAPPQSGEKPNSGCLIQTD